METVALLYGGKSGEHEVSLRSAGSVYSHLDKKKYTVVLIGIDIHGEWFYQKTELYGKDGESLALKKENPVSILPGKGLYAEGKNLNIDFVFPVLHGTFGEDGTIQGVLEIADIPYAGSGVLGSAAGMDKCISKQLWQQQGLPVVPFKEIISHTDIRINDAVHTFGFPLFVKPARAGSSVGVRKVESRKDLIAALEYAFQFDSKVVIERAIQGREIECSVLGEGSPESFPPGEICLTEGFYDYTNKYLTPEKANIIVPADLSDQERIQIKQYAEKAFLAVEASGFARVDFFIEKGTGRILINEINTIPGFTSISMFSKLCEAGGVPYPTMLDRVITMGKETYKKKKKLKRIPDGLLQR